MTIKHKFAMPDPEPTPSSGTGVSNPTGSQFDPNTGAKNPNWKPQPESPRLSTVGGLDSELSRGRGHEDAYRAAQRAALGCNTDCGAGMGLDVKGDSDSSFTTTGSVAESNRQSSSTTGGSDEFVRRSGGGDDDGLRDSNLGAGGKYIAS
jgi:hypothetical protein